MAKYEVKEITSKSVWERFILSRHPKSFLQSWNWGETNHLMGDKIFRLGFFHNGKLRGNCLLIKQSARRGPHFLVPGGPIINWEDKGLVITFLNAIRDLGRREKVWFIRVRPELLDTPTNRRIFSSHGFVRAPMHLHAENTLVLPITNSEERIMKGMRKNTRYSVKKSLKSGLTLIATDDISKVSILKKLQDETVARHKFVGFSEKFFKAQLETFGRDKQSKLFIVSKRNENLVAAIIIFYGDYAYYHHSGSSSKFREIPSSYFLQWKVIQEAKKRKLKGYNFWGIAPEGSRSHRFSGVTTFKTGFGGERVDWLHAHDLPISPLYWTTYVFERVRRLFRGL